MNTKLRAICDSQDHPLNLLMPAGQVSDYIGALALLSSLSNVEWLLGDRGYDADWFRETLEDKEIRACMPGRKQRKKTVKYDKRRCTRHNRIEIMFAQGLAACGNPLRPLPKGLPLSNRHLLAISPEPRQTAFTYAMAQTVPMARGHRPHQFLSCSPVSLQFFVAFGFYLREKLA